MMKQTLNSKILVTGGSGFIGSNLCEPSLRVKRSNLINKVNNDKFENEN